MSKVAYKIPEAAEQVGVSEKTIRRAIKATDYDGTVRPLEAVNIGTDAKPLYRITHEALMAWIASYPAA